MLLSDLLVCCALPELASALLVHAEVSNEIKYVIASDSFGDTHVRNVHEGNLLRHNNNCRSPDSGKEFAKSNQIEKCVCVRTLVLLSHTLPLFQISTANRRTIQPVLDQMHPNQSKKQHKIYDFRIFCSNRHGVNLERWVIDET